MASMTPPEMRSLAHRIVWDPDLSITDFIWLDRIRRMHDDAPVDERQVAYLWRLLSEFHSRCPPYDREYDENNRLKERE